MDALQPISNGNFDKVLPIIINAHTRALRAVNAELIQMYWEIGQFVSEMYPIAVGVNISWKSLPRICRSIIPLPRAFLPKISGE